MTSMPVQILGAGLTGMSAGHHLGAEFEIHERLGHAGGHAITLERDGWRFDRTGHLLHLRDADMRRWIESLLPGRLVQIERRSRVFSHGAYTRYPYQANTFGLPPEVAYDCLKGYLAAREREATTSEPATFEEFCLKYFGDGFSKHFMIPYNQKLWGVHPREITSEWCRRFVPRPALDDVLAGAVGLNDRELGYNANFLYPRRGIGELPAAIERALPRPIRFDHAPRAVNWRDRKLAFDDGEVPYSVLISTAPLDSLVRLMLDPPEAVAAAGRRLVCNPLWYLDVALDAPCGVDLHWAYVPEERLPFYRVGCYSNFSAEMAPPGKAGLYVELASRETPDMARLLPIVAQGLVEMRLIDAPRQIRFAEPRRIDHAYVVFDRAYYAAMETIRSFLDSHGIVSCGRYGSWTYSSMEDALLEGRNAARRAREMLT